MSNEQTGRLIEIIAEAVEGDENDCDCRECCEALATTIVGELTSKYRLTPIEDNQQEAGT